MADIAVNISTPTIKAELYRATLPSAPSENQAVLDKFSEDENGNLYYGNERIASVPAGGNEGQVLTKKSDTDYDYGWKNSVTLEYNSGVLSIF